MCDCLYGLCQSHLPVQNTISSPLHPSQTPNVNHMHSAMMCCHGTCQYPSPPPPTPECFEGTCGELCGEFCEEGEVCDYEGTGHCVAGVCSCV